MREDLQNERQLTPRLSNVDPLIILRTDLILRGKLKSIIVVVGEREIARIVGPSAASCEVAVHVVDRVLLPSLVPQPESIINESTAATLPDEGRPVQSPRPASEVEIDTSGPVVEPGLTAALLEGILDFEDDLGNN